MEATLKDVDNGNEEFVRPPRKSWKVAYIDHVAMEAMRGFLIGGWETGPSALAAKCYAIAAEFVKIRDENREDYQLFLAKQNREFEELKTLRSQTAQDQKIITQLTEQNVGLLGKLDRAGQAASEMKAPPSFDSGMGVSTRPIMDKPGATSHI